jgi:hypothetical protein
VKQLTPVIILVIAVGVLALRVWLRSRRGGPARPAWPVQRVALARLTGYTGLVAAREIRQRIRGRLFRAGTLLILAVVAAAIVIPVLNQGKSRQSLPPTPRQRRSSRALSPRPWA